MICSSTIPKALCNLGHSLRFEPGTSFTLSPNLGGREKNGLEGHPQTPGSVPLHLSSDFGFGAKKLPRGFALGGPCPVMAGIQIAFAGAIP